jgi:arylsulfatase A-like enzyme
MLAACTSVPPPEPLETPLAEVHYDLARHHERAELRQGGFLVLDMTRRGGSKYSHGGWRSGLGPAGAGGAAIEGSSAGLIVPVDFEGDGVLSMRCVVHGGNWASLYLDGEKLADFHVRPGVATTLTAGVPSIRLGRGEHWLGITVPGDGAIHRVRIGPLRGGTSDDDMLVGPVPAETDDLVAIPSGWTVGHTLEVPAGARLVAGVRSTRRGWIKATMHRDGAEPVLLAKKATHGSGASLDVDLGHLAGQVVRIDLTAGPLDIVVGKPRIVVPPAGKGVERHVHARNVILYLVDTLRADKLSAYNPGTAVLTPGMDRFAQKAAVFERSHAPANWTKPSVATLMSSRLPWQHGAVTHEAVMPDDVPLVQELMQEHGFYTAGFVTNGFITGKFGFKRGWHDWSHSGASGRARAAIVVDDVLSWLDTRPAIQPFFIYIHTTDPHSPYAPPGDLLELYDPEPYAGVVNFGRDRTLLAAIREDGLELDARDRVRLEALYDGEVTYHDEQFARLVEGLELRGLGSDTLVVFVADHGEEFYDHGSVGHGQTLHEEMLHVPIVIRWPGVTDRAVRIDDPAGLVDVAPTILEALGLPVPLDMEGRSLVPLLLGERPNAPRVTVSGTKDHWRSIVVGRFKLIEHATSRHTTTPSLFDLEADPGELHDLSASLPLTLRYLRGLLGLRLAGIASAAGKATSTLIDGDTRHQLIELGYLRD